MNENETRRDTAGNPKLQKLMERCGHFLYHRRGGKIGQKRILQILHDYEQHADVCGQDGEHKIGLTQQELQNTLGIRSGSVSEIIGKMEASGLIIKTRQENDRRRICLALTDMGREAVEKTMLQNARQEAMLFEMLSLEEQNELIRLLTKLLEGWEERFDPELVNGGHHFRDDTGE